MTMDKPNNIPGIHFSNLLESKVEVNLPREKALKPIETLDQLKINQVLVDNIARLKIKDLTPVQKYVIPAIQDGNNVMTCSATGSGKSFAFLIPMLNRFLEKEVPANGAWNNWNEPVLPKALILAPTRELAEQIGNEARSYCKGSWFATHIHNIIGGCDMRSEDCRFHRRPMTIVVATIGRLLHRKELSHIDFSAVQYLVIDEAAEMFRKGFVKDVISIAKACHRGVQTMMFSAAYPNEVIKAGEILLKEHVRIIVGCLGSANEDIGQELCLVELGDKMHELKKLLSRPEYKKIVVYCATKELATNVFNFVNDTCSTSAAYIHSDLEQSDRENALYGLTHGRIRVMIATSVMARGIDVPNVDLVVNYDIPDDPEEYILRIGRTGRIGNEGSAISFFHPVLDGPKAGSLISILRSSKQSVPKWLENIAADEAQIEKADAEVFGVGFDYGERKRNAIGSAPRGVPLCVEVQDTEW